MWSRRTVTDDRKAWLRGLAPEFRRDVGNVRLRFVHGSPRRMNEYLFEDRDPASLARIARIANCDVLVFGHTHLPWTREIDGVLFVNTGSTGKPKDGDPRAGWVMLTIEGDGVVSSELHRCPYDVAAMAAAIRATPELSDHYAIDLETGDRHP
jgi:predicted phosphodiesterase